jgi:membrane-bound serine protease (ClpP class)
VRRLARVLLAATFAAVGLAGLSASADASVARGSESAPPDDDVRDEQAADAVASDASLAPVDVLQVSGLVDGIVIDAIDAAIERASTNGSQALILQVNSLGAVAPDDEVEALIHRVANAPVSIGIWIGPSRSARLYGTPAQLMGVADVTAMVSGSRIGHIGVPVAVDGVQVSFGAATEQLREDSLSFQEARSLGALRLDTPDEGVPTIRNMVLAMDDIEVDGRVLDTVTADVDDEGNLERSATLVRFSKLDLVDQLMHTMASPPVAYLMLLIGLALLVFEFFTAGVGVAGVVGAAFAFFGCYGLAALPARGWAVALIVLAMLAFAIDVQVGIPRFWTGVGIVMVIVGSWWLYEPLAGTSLRPGWITLLAGVGGIMLAFIVGMPSMVRTRFATPTIGREWMIGKLGRAAGDISPDGVVVVADARWRARTTRATPVRAGAAVRVVAIDGVTLEVEPEEGGARDYREHR